MKKIFKLLALSLALLLLVGCFVACGKDLSGVYKASNGATYEFDGNEFTYYTSDGGYILKGTFEIEQQDEDYRIFLTVEKSGSTEETLTPIENPYVIGGEDNGVEYRFQDMEGNTYEDGHIKIGEYNYFPVE